jgi:hypothetical protein
LHVRVMDCHQLKGRILYINYHLIRHQRLGLSLTWLLISSNLEVCFY